MNYPTQLICKFTLSIAIIFSVGLASATAQTWTSANGKFEINAEFVQLKDDKVQLKRDDNGKLIWVDLKKLSKRDQSKAKRLQDKMEVAARPKQKAGESNTEQLLDQLKVDCTVKIGDVVQWGDEQNETGQPVVTLTATGPPAADAIRYGKLQIKKFIDSDGKAIKQEADKFSMNDITKELTKIDRDSDFFNVHPDDGVAVEIKLPSATASTKIAELSGHFSLLTGGEKTTAEVEGLADLIGKPLRNDALKEAGLKIKMEDLIDENQMFGLSFTVSGKLKLISNIYVGDSDGKKFDSQNGNSTSGFNNRANFSFFFSEEITENAVLHVEIVKGAVELKVPFSFTNLEIPSAK